MQLKVLACTCVPDKPLKMYAGQLLRLVTPMGDTPAGTLGYLSKDGGFVIIAGAPLGIVEIDFDVRIEILTSGTLTLEVE